MIVCVAVWKYECLICHIKPEKALGFTAFIMEKL
uniref:Uncharacterized protein n=1 Tax=Anguilla anguilla TaxID=7936 RepID=A0A0E9WD61_ANGAN